MTRAPCPTCRRPASADPTNRWRPFCSEDCQLRDLARWLDGAYVIHGEPVPPDAIDDDSVAAPTVAGCKIGGADA